MPSGTGLDKVREAFPDRTFDVGIAEQHAVTFAAGLAAQGKRPFCAIYSTFLQRAYDQVVHDVAIQNLPVRFAIDRAGLVGADGATHAGSFDLAYLCTLPNFVVMAAADEAELVHMVHTMAAPRQRADRGPLSARQRHRRARCPKLPQGLEIGKGRIVREGKKVAILSLGTRLAEALKAADLLEAKGLSTTVADLRFAKPLDEELIRRLLTTHEVAVTIEEASIGGLGAHVLTLASDEGLIDAGLKLRTMRLPDRLPGPGQAREAICRRRPRRRADRRDGAEGAAGTTAPAWRRRGPEHPLAEVAGIPVPRPGRSACPSHGPADYADRCLVGATVGLSAAAGISRILGHGPGRTCHYRAAQGTSFRNCLGRRPGFPHLAAVTGRALHSGLAQGSRGDPHPFITD